MGRRVAINKGITIDDNLGPVSNKKLVPGVEQGSANDRPRADDVINFDALPDKNAQELAAEIKQRKRGIATAKRLGGKYRPGK